MQPIAIKLGGFDYKTILTTILLSSIEQIVM